MSKTSENPHIVIENNSNLIENIYNYLHNISYMIMEYILPFLRFDFITFEWKN